MVELSHEKHSKHKRDDGEDESITSPLPYEKKEKSKPLASEERQISLVNLISDSAQHTEHPSKVRKGYFDDWDPLLFKTSNDDVDVNESLAQRVAMLERCFIGIKQSIDELKETMSIYHAQTDGMYHTPPQHKVLLPTNPSSTPRTSGMIELNTTARILKKLNEYKVNEPEGKGSVRKLFSPNKTSTPIVTTKTSTGYQFVSKKRKNKHSKLVGPSIPNWLTLMFQLKRTMKLNDEECAMASYIFGSPPHKQIDEKEVMVSAELGYDEGTRGLLQCLKPKQMIFQDIIDLAVCMLTHNARKEMLNPTIWFMPTTLSQYVMSWNSPLHSIMKSYQKRFMATADLVSKIFLPVHDMEHLHWFLLVIDFVKKELVYLDSYQTSSAHDGRMTSIKKLAIFMQELLMDPSFYDTDTMYQHKISEFKLVTPHGLGTQPQGLNDCAIWVIKWMMKKGSNGYKIKVDDGSRLRIALDLTMDDYNKNKDLILSKAVQQKDDDMEGNAAE